MEIKYAYEMTRKAEEVRKEIQAKNNALAHAPKFDAIIRNYHF
jgi:hypothetical protein